MNNNTDNILLVGDIRKAFLNTDFVTRHGEGRCRSGANLICDICKTLPEAIEAARNNTFSAIAIVMFGIQTKLLRHPENNVNVGGLNSSIKTLRDINSAKIILLAQMYEEPIAIRLVCSSYNDKPLVDDYMICPVQTDNFFASVLGSHGTRDTGHGTQVTCREPHGRATSDELSMRIRHLEKMATEDDLTGLKNRRYIMEFTRQIIEYAQKENGRVTLLMFDIDDFKKYNDLYGHSAGDEILKQAAILMQRCCRAHDVVGRIGGDEFAVVFWDDPSLLNAVIEQSKINDRRSIDSDHPQEAMLIAKRFVSELEKTELGSRDSGHGTRATDLGPEGTGTLTISGGLASFPRDGKNVKELFELADKALLEAKRSGKNRIYLVGKPKN